MAAVKVILVAAFVALLYKETKAFCDRDSECPGLQTCCNSICRYSCSLGNVCAAKSDCIDSYCCNSFCRKTCIGQFCTSNSQCGHPSNYCCNDECQAHNCSGLSCSLNSQCGGKLYCCGDGKCHDNCIGHRCTLNSNCGDENEYCCGDKCQKGRCSGLATWVIILIVSCVLGGITTLVFAVFCYYKSYRRQRTPGLIVQSSSTMVDISNTNLANLQFVPPKGTK